MNLKKEILLVPMKETVETFHNLGINYEPVSEIKEGHYASYLMVSGVHEPIVRELAIEGYYKSHNDRFTEYVNPRTDETVSMGQLEYLDGLRSARIVFSTDDGRWGLR